MPINLVPLATDTDPGVVVKHETFDDTEYVLLRSVVSDAAVTAANVAANKSGKYVASDYQVALIMSMVQDWRIKDAAGDQISLTEPTVRRLSPQFKVWLVNEINQCDGSIDKSGSTIEIAGVAVPFRKAIGSLG